MPRGKKSIYVEGFTFFFLMDFISRRVMFNEVFCTKVSDLYEDYLYFISQSQSPELEREKIKNKVTVKDPEDFVKKALRGEISLSVIVPKHQFGAILEKLLQEKKQGLVKRKRTQTAVLTGVGLVAPVGIDTFVSPFNPPPTKN